MVLITPFFGAVALLSGFVSALPRPDSSINEPAVSAPNGSPITAGSMPAETGGSMVSGSSSMSSSSSSSSGKYGSSSGWVSSSGGYGSSGGSSSGNYGSSSGNYGSSSGNYGSSSGNYGSSSGNYGSSSGWSGSSGNSGSSTSYSGSSGSSSWNKSPPSYGSGSSSWGNDGYNSCVQQCVASYGNGPSSYSPPPPPSSTYMGSSGGSGSSGSSGSSGGSGATHTVIVAPTQGVLRYIPFALNASVGDTIKFMWGANNHTVTKGSQLTPCNKSMDPLFFTSGENNKDFVFTQVVNDTNPTFFFCNTPGHCQKGMFGIINPPNALAAPTSVSGMMQSLAANSSDISAYASLTDTQTAGNPGAAKWGGNIDMGSMPDWSHSYIAENVMYTRNFLAANPEVMKEDGSVDLSASGSTPLMIPQDLSVALASASGAAPSSPPAAGASGSGTPAAPPAASGSPAVAAAAGTAKSGALSMTSPKVVVGAVAAFATFLML